MYIRVGGVVNEGMETSRGKKRKRVSGGKWDHVVIDSV